MSLAQKTRPSTNAATRAVAQPGNIHSQDGEVRMEPAEAAALLAAELRRSLGSSPQLDRALGHLVSLLG